MRTHIITAILCFVGLLAKADLMLYWTVGVKGYAYASIDGLSGEGAYTVFDSITVGTAHDVLLEAHDVLLEGDDFVGYIISLYDANGQKMLESQSYTRDSLLASGAMWYSDAMWSKPAAPYDFTNSA